MKPFDIFCFSLVLALFVFESISFGKINLFVKASDGENTTGGTVQQQPQSGDASGNQTSHFKNFKFIQKICQSKVFKAIAERFKKICSSVTHYVEDVKNRPLKDLFRRRTPTCICGGNGTAVDGGRIRIRKKKRIRQEHRVDRVKREIEDGDDANSDIKEDHKAREQKDNVKKANNKTNAEVGEDEYPTSFHRSNYPDSLPRISKYELSTNERGDSKTDDRWWNEIDRSDLRRKCNLLKVPTL